MIVMKHLLNKTLTAIRKHEMVSPGMKVCVCLSGGADSSVLLYTMLQLKDELKITLSACHFNHGIRGEEAQRDHAFCKRLCQDYGIPFFDCTVDLPALQRSCGLSMEELARNKRYEWFESLRKEHGIHRFATAHHMSDNAETVLFHAIRGTTVAGLAGIPAVRDAYIRPFLEITKEEILSFAKENDIPFVVDSTNLSTDYTRNYLRHTVFPALERVNPSVRESLSRLSRYATEDQTYMESLLPPFAQSQDGSALPPALLRRLVSRNHQIVTGSGLCYQHLDTIMEAVYSGISTLLTVPGGYECLVSEGSFSFRKSLREPMPILEPGILTEEERLLCGGKLMISFKKSISPKFVYNLSTEILLSSKGIYGMIRYRPRMPGDRLCLRNVNRSVKKLMSESKVPVSIRDMLPVFYDDRGVLAIPFVGVADRAYVPDGEEDLKIQIYINL